MPESKANGAAGPIGRRIVESHLVPRSALTLRDGRMWMLALVLRITSCVSDSHVGCSGLEIAAFAPSQEPPRIEPLENQLSRLLRGTRIYEFRASVSIDTQKSTMCNDSYTSPVF